MAGPIRQPIDLEKFQKYIEDNVKDIKTPIDVKQFGYGQSNPTYLLTASDGGRYVMRKKPPGKLLSKTAHRVDREYRILHALQDTDVAAPKTYILCEDDDIIGTPFYIMEYLDGRIFEDPAMPGISAEDRTTMWHDAIRQLARFHRIDPASVSMSTFGKPKGFYNRQIALFRSLCVAQASTTDVESQDEVGQIPHFDDIMKFFSSRRTQPRDRGTFVHGDFKIDNVVFHKTEPRVIGILDWEMSTIGHPLADLCNLLTPYVTASSPLAMSTLSQTPGGTNTGAASSAFQPNTTPGLPTRAQCIEWYAEVAGWTPSSVDLAWGDAFSLYKLCVILQGIAARYARRQASSAKAKEQGKKMMPMGEVTWELVERCMAEAERARI